jgi:hypothetical protein
VLGRRSKPIRRGGTCAEIPLLLMALPLPPAAMIGMAAREHTGMPTNVGFTLSQSRKATRSLHTRRSAVNSGTAKSRSHAIPSISTT